MKLESLPCNHQCRSTRSWPGVVMQPKQPCSVIFSACTANSNNCSQNLRQNRTPCYDQFLRSDWPITQQHITNTKLTSNTKASTFRAKLGQATTLTDSSSNTRLWVWLPQNNKHNKVHNSMDNHESTVCATTTWKGIKSHEQDKK